MRPGNFAPDRVSGRHAEACCSPREPVTVGSALRSSSGFARAIVAGSELVISSAAQVRQIAERCILQLILRSRPVLRLGLLFQQILDLCPGVHDRFLPATARFREYSSLRRCRTIRRIWFSSSRLTDLPKSSISSARFCQSITWFESSQAAARRASACCLDQATKSRSYKFVGSAIAAPASGNTVYIIRSAEEPRAETSQDVRPGIKLDNLSREVPSPIIASCKNLPSVLRPTIRG